MLDPFIAFWLVARNVQLLAVNAAQWKEQKRDFTAEVTCGMG